MKPVLLHRLEAPETLELDANENPLGPSRRAWKAVMDSMGRAGRYPEQDCVETEERIARVHKLSPSHIVLGPGAFGVLRFIADACMTPGCEVVFAEPGYPMYRYLTYRKRSIPVSVPLTADYRHDLPAMLAAIGPKTRVVFICNPNNPTGRPVSHAELSAFMEQAPPHVLVVLDEAYYEYASGPDMPDGMDWVRAGRNVVVLRTFSKAYGLAGMRVGYGVAHEQVAAMLRQVREPYSVNTLAQMAARAALEDKTHVAAVRVLNEQVRTELCAALERLGVPFIPSVTNFVMIQCGGDDVSMAERMAGHGVLVRPGTEYGMRGWLRVSTGTSEQCQRFLLTLQSLLPDHA